MRVLVLCNHGNVRSVGLAYLIKTIYKHDVLTAGVEENSSETLSQLRSWAEKIISLTKEAHDMYPESIFIDVGKDTWHNPFDQQLQHKLLKQIKNLDL